MIDLFGNENTSSTIDVENEVKNPNIEDDGWDILEIEKSEFTIDELVRTLHTVSTFREKYPNDDVVKTFERIVRDEICLIMGGHID